MNYDQFFNKIVKNTPISGIRQVNLWDSEVPVKKQIWLSVGQPDLNTPDYIKNSVKEALENNLTRYTQVLGETYLRQAIIEYEKDFNNTSLSLNEILVTGGAQSAIFATLQAILSPNDNIIVPFPSYPSYINAILYNRANVVPITTRVEENFDIPIQRLKEILEQKPIKALLLISPGNPTGAIIPKKTLYEIALLAVKYNFLIISDEIYRKILFDNQLYTSISSFSEASDRTIMIKSFSKFLSMCGFRIGYISAPEPIIDKIKIVHHTMNICANSLAQYAAYKALASPEQLKNSINHLVQTYQERRDLALEILGESSHLTFSKPEGAFYIFPKVDVYDTLQFCKWLKLKFGVITVPGAFFSMKNMKEHNQYFRICFTTSNSNLDKGLKNILLALENYPNKI
ncbi:MAG: pyridoxal phosphate-dependent aminotransferase [Candidatus Heimdallarchaeota archaeon]|nr:pyridoxal phosphate-dependent aminotransferase [Candidatus Heimdallarchaeota archaeon]